MTNNDKTRFDDLFNTVNKDKKESSSQNESDQKSLRKKSKSSDPDYIRTTIYLPKKLHKKLKSAALDEDKEMSGIVESLIEVWLSSRESD